LRRARRVRMHMMTGALFWQCSEGHRAANRLPSPEVHPPSRQMFTAKTFQNNILKIYRKISSDCRLVRCGLLLQFNAPLMVSSLMTSPLRRRDSISFACPSCRQAFAASGFCAGRAMSCPQCAAAMTVPVVTEPPLLRPIAPAAPGAAVASPVARTPWVPESLKVNAAFLNHGASVRPQPRGSRIRSIARPS